MRRLPAYLAGGPEVSDLLYLIVVDCFRDRPPAPPRGLAPSNCEMIDRLAERYGVDEFEILTALAEAQRKGLTA